MASIQLGAISLEADHIKLIVIGVFIVGGILGYTLIATIGNVFNTRATEQTKREIAAYVAEGTITPETAQMMLSADSKKPWEQQVAEMISEGTIDTKEAEKLLRMGPKSAAAGEVSGQQRQPVVT